MYPIEPAAFGRLCVETRRQNTARANTCPAAFGRLCVETDWNKPYQPQARPQPPSGGCVLKHLNNRDSYLF